MISYPLSSSSRPTPKIMATILENIGNTPMVRLNNIPKKEGIKCEMCKLQHEGTWNCNMLFNETGLMDAVLVSCTHSLMHLTLMHVMLFSSPYSSG